MRSRTHYLGVVYAPDEKSAEAAAIAEFKIAEDMRRRPSRHRDGPARHFIERAPAIVPAGALNAAPLLEEKSRLCLTTCDFNLRDPLLGHRSRTRAALAADDCPLNALQIGPNHRPEQRLKRNKP